MAPTRTRTDGPAARSPVGSRGRLIGIVVALAVAMALVAGSCSGSDRAGSTTTSTLDPDDAATDATAPPVRVFSDPSQPIDVALGDQFAIVLTAEPGAGKSWRAVTGPDLQILVSVGTEFREAGDAVTGQTLPPDSVSQVMRYAARSLGTTQIALRYGQVTTAQPGDPTMTFTVNVIDPNAPTTTAPPPTDTTSTTTAAPPPTSRPCSTTTTTTPKRTTTTT